MIETNLYDDDDYPHGYWLLNYSNDKIWYEGYYIHGVRKGLWKFYDIYDKENNINQKFYYLR